MDVRQAFILKALTEYNTRTIAQMRAIAKRMGIGVTSEGLNSLAYRIAENGKGAVSNLSFNEYLRMVDMGAGRGHPLGGLRQTLVELQSRNHAGFAQVKDNIRRPKKFYSKTAYGNIGILQNDLLYGLTEEVKADITKQLKNGNSTY